MGVGTITIKHAQKGVRGLYIEATHQCFQGAIDVLLVHRLVHRIDEML